MKATCRDIIAVSHPNGCTVPRHSHPYHELVYCLEGNGTVEISGKKHAFSTGNYYITCAGTPHTEWDDRTTRIVYFYFDAQRETVAEGAYTDYDGSVGHAVRKLLSERDRALPHKGEMLRSLVVQILIEAARAADTQTTDFATAVQYVDENTEQDIDFRQLAAAQGYSYERFRHIFKAHTGAPPHQYLLARRIEKAKFLLTLHPHISLTDVALSCGFSSPSQFSNLFRAKIGISPRTWRTQGK